MVLRTIRYGPFFKRVWPNTHSRNKNNVSQRNGRSGGWGAVHQVIGVAPSQSQIYRQHAAVPVAKFLQGLGPRTATRTEHRMQRRLPLEWLDESLTCNGSTHPWKPMIEETLAVQQVLVILPLPLECDNFFSDTEPQAVARGFDGGVEVAIIATKLFSKLLDGIQSRYKRSGCHLAQSIWPWFSDGHPISMVIS